MFFGMTNHGMDEFTCRSISEEMGIGWGEGAGTPPNPLFHHREMPKPIARTDKAMLFVHAKMEVWIPNRWVKFVKGSYYVWQKGLLVNLKKKAEEIRSEHKRR